MHTPSPHPPLPHTTDPDHAGVVGDPLPHSRAALDPLAAPAVQVGDAPTVEHVTPGTESPYAEPEEVAGEPDTRYVSLSLQQYRATEMEREQMLGDGPWTHTLRPGDTLRIGRLLPLPTPGPWVEGFQVLLVLAAACGGGEEAGGGVGFAGQGGRRLHGGTPVN